jgi:hypothetical protein
VCWGRSDLQWTLLTFRFGDENAAARLWLVRLHSQVVRQFVQPLLNAVFFDVRELLAVDPRRTTVGTAAVEGEAQDVATVQLVVQRIEAIAGRSLRFGMQSLLEFPNLFRSCEAHANLPALKLFRTSILNSGSFPPPALTGFEGTTILSATPFGRACPSRASRWESRAPADGVSRVAVVPHVSTCRCHYPGEIVGSDRSWDGLFHPFPSSPTTTAFPVYVAGRLPRYFFRGLLSIRSRYGLSTRGTAKRYIILEGSDGFVTSTASSIASGRCDRVGRAGLALAGMTLPCHGAHIKHIKFPWPGAARRWSPEASNGNCLATDVLDTEDGLSTGSPPRSPRS